MRALDRVWCGLGVLLLAAAVWLSSSCPLGAQHQAPPETAKSKGSGGPAISGSRGPAETKTQPNAAHGQVALVALLTQDGQRIEQGIVWRVFNKDGQSQGKAKLVSHHREAAPLVRLAPGEYLVNAAFGRAHLTRRITVKPGAPAVETFVLNAGGLRLAAVVGNGEPAPPSSVSYAVFSDERDQFGNRMKILGHARPGVVVRLNSGIYHLVSTYGDVNATVRTDVTVEAGKLTEVTVAHAAAKVTFKLVTRSGGEALADTHWSVLNPQGEVVKETVGALPTHTLAPGSYTVHARSAGRVYRREFTIEHGDSVEVEVVMQ
jgi:hypothetical protein